MKWPYICIYYMVKYIAEDVNMIYNELVTSFLCRMHCEAYHGSKLVFFLALFAVVLS